MSLLALAGVTAIAWLYLFIARQDMDMPMPAMDDMPDMAMPFAGTMGVRHVVGDDAGHDAAEPPHR